MRMHVVQNPSGFDVPIGSVILWYGDSTNVPIGWQIDTSLMGHFVKGGSAPNLTAAGALTHYHTNNNVETKADHVHATSTSVTGGYSSTAVGGYYSNVLAAEPGHSHAGSAANTGSAGGHTHALGNTGSSPSLPTYKRLYYIKKVS